MGKWIVFVATALCCASGWAGTRCEANLNGFRIHNVYIVGSQYNGVAWAYKHIADATCLTPVIDPSKADAILEIVSSVHQQQTEPESLVVTCNSSGASSSCIDSDGNEMDVSCSGGSCSSYYGPSPGVVLLHGLADAMRNAWYQSDARLYTADHKLIWKSQGQKGQHWYDLWPDLLREATFTSPCNVPAAKSGDKFRKYAANKCDVSFDPLVSIDLKIRAKKDAAAQQAAEQQHMIQNAREAAQKQRQQ